MTVSLATRPRRASDFSWFSQPSKQSHGHFLLPEQMFDNIKGRSVKELLIGTYDMRYLCLPVFPYFRKGKGVPPPRFFAVDEFLGLFVALVMGLQHALAMVGGLITPPLLVSSLAMGTRPKTNIPYASGNPYEIQRYLVQAALIVCGIMTFFQVAGFRIFRTPFQFGAGVLSCMGVSFTTVPIAISVINVLMKDHGNTFEEAYGKLLGTLMLCSIIPTILSFFPIRVIKKIFPPIVCGVVIMLIGVHLISAGFKNWGGGAFCADNWLHGPTTSPCMLANKYPNGTTLYNKPALCYVTPGVKCGDKTKTEVFLPFGSQQYIGLGFIVFFSIIFLEIFGSPFMRNSSVILALLFGYLIAACIKFEGKKYVITTKIDQAPGITFLWTKTFPIGFYAPAIVPLCIVFIITSIETVGDTSATMEASRMEVDGQDATRRIKGALLNDGISGLFSALATSLPLTTFAQNNGVISLTNVASRQAGFAAAFWLFLLGILGKVGAWITTIPEPVLGGMTTFLFANVIASGIKIIINGDPLTRRSRFILACSLALAFGVELVPQWATNQLWPITPEMSSGVRGIRDAIILVLSTSFTFGAVTALILNLIIPVDVSDPTSTGRKHGDFAADRTTSTSGKEEADEDYSAVPPYRATAVAAENSGSDKPVQPLAITVAPPLQEAGGATAAVAVPVTTGTSSSRPNSAKTRIAPSDGSSATAKVADGV